ncbi:MAG: nucleotide exchange factor GrpE [Candidatus Brocadiae bacterium]|nr:nucleotide exchange factor GrpE [Candidatus Brocadiia bacterium]
MEEPRPEAEPATPPPPAPPPTPSPPDPRVDRVLDKISILEQLFVKRIKDDTVHAAAYNALYQDMSKYRDDGFSGAQKPILKGMVLLYDTMKRSLAGLTDPDGRQAVELHLEEVLELLHRHDVERMPEGTARYDRTFQQVLGTEPASGPEDDQTVARVVRDGFRWGTQVLRPQEVVIRVHKP